MNFRAGQGSVPRGGWTGRFRGNKTTNPLSLALLACGGMAVAYCLFRSSDAAASLASVTGFTDAQRNDAMGVDGVTTTWNQAVAEDITSWNEPFNGIMDLPADLAQIQATLPKDFDPSLGSIDADGIQTGQPTGEVLSDEDYDAILDGDDDDDDDADADADISISGSSASDDAKPSQSNRYSWDDDTSSRSYTPTHTSSDDSSGSSGSDSSSSSSSDSSSSSSSSD